MAKPVSRTIFIAHAGLRTDFGLAKLDTRRGPTSSSDDLPNFGLCAPTVLRGSHLEGQVRFLWIPMH